MKSLILLFINRNKALKITLRNEITNSAVYKTEIMPLKITLRNEITNSAVLRVIRSWTSLSERTQTQILKHRRLLLKLKHYRPHNGNQHVMHIHISHTRWLLIGRAEWDENSPNNDRDVGERPRYFHLSNALQEESERDSVR